MFVGLRLHRHSLHVCQCSIVTSASRGPTEQVTLPGRAGGRLPGGGSQHGGLRARLQLHEDKIFK